MRGTQSTPVVAVLLMWALALTLGCVAACTTTQNAMTQSSQSATMPGGTSKHAAESAPSMANRYALVVGCRGGNSEQDSKVQALCGRTKELLLKAGFDEATIIVFSKQTTTTTATSQPASSDALLASLAGLAERLHKQDELWVFIYGHANANPRGYSLTLSSSRLKGKELAIAMGKVQCHQAVFCMTRQSSALLEQLKSPDRVVVAACDDENQLDSPEMPGILLGLWQQDPSRPLLDVLVDSGNAVEELYKAKVVLQSERACAWDSETLASAPFKELSGGRLGRLRMKSSDANRDAWSGNVPATGTTSPVESRPAK